MRRQNLLVNCAAAALAMSFGMSAWAAPESGEQPQRNPQQQQEQGQQQQQQRQQENEAGEQGREGQRGQAPQGFVLIRTRTISLMGDEPQRHLKEARAAMARREPGTAAEETGMAAACMDMQAARQGDPQQANDLRQQANNLRRQARQLRRMARTIQRQQNQQAQQQQGQQQPGEQAEQGSISDEQLDKGFARASDALAKHFDAMTKQDLQKQDYEAAGYDLDATAENFKNMVILSNRPLSQDDLNVIHNAVQTAFNLRSNEIEQGEQALKTEQKEANREQANKGEGQPGQAEQANAKLPAGVTNSPLTGTTPAEARNDVQHAQELAGALGKAIEQHDQQIGGEGANQAEHEQEGQKANQEKDQSGNLKSR